jgi:hypothetical protein
MAECKIIFFFKILAEWSRKLFSASSVRSRLQLQEYWVAPQRCWLVVDGNFIDKMLLIRMTVGSESSCWSGGFILKQLCVSNDIAIKLPDDQDEAGCLAAISYRIVI